jgi:hypothetical protein
VCGAVEVSGGMLHRSRMERTLTAIEPKAEQHLRNALILTKQTTDDHVSVPDIWPEMFCGNRGVNSRLGH